MPWAIAAVVALGTCFGALGAASDRERIGRRDALLARRSPWTRARLAHEVGAPRAVAAIVVVEAIAHVLALDASRLRPTDRLIDDLWIDGPGWISDLTATEIVLAIEERLAIRIADDVPATTIAELIDVVAARRRS